MERQELASGLFDACDPEQAGSTFLAGRWGKIRPASK